MCVVQRTVDTVRADASEARPRGTVFSSCTCCASGAFCGASGATVNPHLLAIADAVAALLSQGGSCGGSSVRDSGWVVDFVRTSASAITHHDSVGICCTVAVAVAALGGGALCGAVAAAVCGACVMGLFVGWVVVVYGHFTNIRL